MVKYYDINKKELTRDYAKEVPLEFLIKRGQLPYEENIVRLPEGEVTELVEGIVILDDKVVNTIFERYHIPTLDELKTSKLFSLKFDYNNLINEAYPIWKQLNIFRLAEGYTEQDKIDMETFIDTKRNECNVFENLINETITIEGLDLINWSE